MRNRIIRAENYKIRRNLTVRIAILVVVCAVIAGCALFYGAMHIISGELIEAAGGYATDKDAFDDINLFDCGGIVLSFAQLLLILFAVVLTMLISAEKKNGVYSLMLSRGYTSGQIYAAKVYETVVVSAILYLVCTVVSLAAGAIFWHGEIEREDITGFIRVFFLLFFMYLASALILSAIALNVKNAATAIAVNLLLIIVFSSVITGVDQALFDGDAVLRKYWIFSAIEQFAYIDYTETTVRETILGIGEAVLYGGIASAAGYFAFAGKKRERTLHD